MSERKQNLDRDREALTPAELEARRQWYREYRARNPAKVKMWEKNRWHKKAQQMQQQKGG